VLGPDNERDDLVQDVFIAVIRKIATVRDPDALDAWVFQVTSNTVSYALRRRRLRRHASWEALPDWQSPSFQHDVVARELASRAVDLMDRLPQNDRALLTTYWFSPATARAIAEERGCSLATIRRRLFKARARFEKLARRDPALARCIDDARGASREVFT